MKAVIGVLTVVLAASFGCTSRRTEVSHDELDTGTIDSFVPSPCPDAAPRDGGPCVHPGDDYRCRYAEWCASDRPMTVSYVCARSWPDAGVGFDPEVGTGGSAWTYGGTTPGAECDAPCSGTPAGPPRFSCSDGKSCLDYIGPDYTSDKAKKYCDSGGGILSIAPCAASVGSCILSCGLSDEAVLHVYDTMTDAGGFLRNFCELDHGFLVP